MKPDEKIVEFTCKYLTPPSANHYKTPSMYTGKDGYAHRGFKLTPEAKAFKDAVAIFAQGRTVVPALEKQRIRARYRVNIHVVLGPRKRLDCDNSAKVGLDSLQACGVIDTDAKVIECNLTINRKDRENPRTEFHVERLEIN